jgi:hypothetical protein
MTRILRRFAALLFLWPCVDGFAAVRHAPQIVSVCQVLNHPSRYTYQDISLDARVLSDGQHSTLLIDEQCPKTGIPIGATEGNEDPSVTKLGQYILNVGKPGTQGKLITGRFIGRLRLPKDRRHMNFDLKSIRNLTMTETPEK